MGPVTKFFYEGVQMKNLFLIVFLIQTTAMAAEQSELPLSFNEQKFALLIQAQETQETEIAESIKKKSGLTAAVLSAVLPGAGEVYAGSYWKAALFAGLEVAFWTAQYVYTGKGDDEDKLMRTFGDLHWSEQVYWSNVYRNVKDKSEWTGGVLEVDGMNILTANSYTAENINALRAMESVAGYSHSLPTTKTQQYYEMIYKYLHQFGVGWDDVAKEHGDRYFYDVELNWRYPTTNVKEYRSMRELSNSYYETAKNMAILVMVNHLASLFDAAYTVHQNNRKLQYSFQMKPQYNGYGYTTTYGLNIGW